MTTKKFLKIIIPMIVLFFVLAGIIYINFQQSKFKIEEGFNIKNISLRINKSLDYIITKQDTLKDFYYNIEELKEDKVTLKALEGRPYTSIILKGEKDSKELKLFDENIVYNNKVYGGKAVQLITNLVEKEIASESFIQNYISYSLSVEFKINELERSFDYYYVDYLSGKGKRSELTDFFKDAKFNMVDSEKVKTLKRTYPSYIILLGYSTYDSERNIQGIDIFGDNIMALTINGKKYYIESDKNIYDFVNKRLPKYELGDLGDLYKATAVKDKETGLDLMYNINLLNRVLTQHVLTENTSSPSKAKRVVTYTINGKDEELTVFADKISFRGKEYVVSNVGKNYEVNFLVSKDDKNKISRNEQRTVGLKDGEMAVVVNDLLVKQIKDEKFMKQINDMFDKVDELIKDKASSNNKIINRFNVVRRKNGVNETLNFSSETLGRDGKYLTNDITKVEFEEVSKKLLNEYILKIQDLKSLKGLVTEAQILAEVSIINSTLSESQTNELINILAKSKLEVSNFKINEKPKLGINLYNGNNGVFLYILDEKVYLLCNFNDRYTSDKCLVINNNKELLRFINSITPKQNLFKPILPIDKGEEVTLKYDGKTLDGNSKKGVLQNIIWSSTNLVLPQEKSLMDIGDKEMVITFEYKDKVNTVRINKDGVYQNGSLMYSGRYYTNLVYNQLLIEFGI